MNNYTCYVCRCSYPDKSELINAFSEEGKKNLLEDKVLLVTSTLMYEHDTASNYICHSCISSLDFNYKFNIAFKKNNNKTLDELRCIPGNKSFLDERELLEKTFTIGDINELFSNSTTLQGKSEQLKKKIQERLLQARPNQDQPILHRNNNGRVKNGHVSEKSIVVDNGTKTSTSLSTHIPVTDKEEIRPKLVKLVKNGHVSDKNVVDKRTKTSSSLSTHIPVTDKKEIRQVVEKIILKRANKEYTNLADNGTSQCYQISKTDIPETVKLENKPNIFVHKNNVDNADNGSTKNTVKQEIIPDIAAGLDNNNSIVTRKITNDQSSTSISDIGHLMVTPIITEEMTVTPDMPLPLYQEDPALHNINVPMVNLPQNTQLQNSNMLTNGPTLVTPETGFHFLYESEQSVDLTHEPEEKKTEKDNTKRKYQTDDTPNIVMPPPKKLTNMQNQPGCSKSKELSPIISKILTTTKASSPTNKTKKSKAVNLPNLPGCSKSKKSSAIISKTSTAPRASSTYKTKKSVKLEPKYTKSQRPKRASVTYNKQLKKSGLWKLGHQSNQNGWTVNLDRAPMYLYQCCICQLVLPSIESREKHEKCHKLPEFTSEQLTDFAAFNESDSSVSAEKKEFLSALKLVVRVNPLKQNYMVQLAQDKQMIDGLRSIGNSFSINKCRQCTFKTCYPFILWAHISSVHNVIQLSKPSSYCSNCDRSMGKRTQYLKHLDKCLVNRIINKPSSNLEPCVLCKGERFFSTKKRLNIHFMSHFSGYFMEK